MSHATASGSNLYGDDWSGSPATNYTLAGMSAAIAALTAAIGPDEPPSTKLHKVTLSRSAIIGVIVAGTILLSMMVCAGIYLICRRRRRRSISYATPSPLEPPSGPDTQVYILYL
jgi:hypothetical protein